MPFLTNHASIVSFLCVRHVSGCFFGIAARGIIDRLVRCEQRPEDSGILVGDGHRRPVRSLSENEVGNPGVSPSEFLPS